MDLKWPRLLIFCRISIDHSFVIAYNKVFLSPMIRASKDGTHDKKENT